MSDPLASGHACPSPGCKESVPWEMFACRVHWFSIPNELRDALWAAYRRHGVGSEEHAAAMRACRDFLTGDGVQGSGNS